MIAALFFVAMLIGGVFELLRVVAANVVAWRTRAEILDLGRVLGVERHPRESLRSYRSRLLPRLRAQKVK